MKTEQPVYFPETPRIQPRFTPILDSLNKLATVYYNKAALDNLRKDLGYSYTAVYTPAPGGKRQIAVTRRAGL